MTGEPEERGINIAEFLHPGYMLNEGTKAILSAAFGQYRTLVSASTADPIRALARRLSLSAYATHMYPGKAGTSFSVTAADEGAVAMMEAARWICADATIQYTFGKGSRGRNIPVQVNDPYSIRAEMPTNGMLDTIHNPFAKDSDPLYLHSMRVHFAESAQYLRNECGFHGTITDLAQIAGDEWPTVACSLQSVL